MGPIGSRPWAVGSSTCIPSSSPRFVTSGKKSHAYKDSNLCMSKSELMSHKESQPDKIQLALANSHFMKELNIYRGVLRLSSVSKTLSVLVHSVSQHLLREKLKKLNSKNGSISWSHRLYDGEEAKSRINGRKMWDDGEDGEQLKSSRRNGS